MARGSSGSFARAVSPDPLYGSHILSRIINNCMLQGKKTTVMALVYKAIDMSIEEIQGASKKFNPEHDDANPVAVVKWFMEFVLNKCVLSVELRSKRMGGANYRIPTPVSRERAVAVGIKRIVSSTRSRKEKGFDRKLAGEFKDIIVDSGEALKKKALLQRDIDANKAFAHYAKSTA
jgi:small subunit ribosomal protein S7